MVAATIPVKAELEEESIGALGAPFVLGPGAVAVNSAVTTVV